jgi:hypothetical protein
MHVYVAPPPLFLGQNTCKGIDGGNDRCGLLLLCQERDTILKEKWWRYVGKYVCTKTSVRD